ncbi:MAG: DUF2012 domain-containing protein [Pyrinomonadaceae bacterium]
MKKITFIFLISLFILSANTSFYAQQTGGITGQVEDTLSAVVVGATVIAVNSEGEEKTTVTNRDGEFTFKGLQPGTYIIRVIAQNFAFYENPEVEVKAGEQQKVSVSLTLETVEEQVEVGAPDQASTDPDNNLTQTRLSEKDLEALPDDPDELEAALQALAGPSAGPNGGQIYIDGFTGGQLPPKESIREIRINSNPFSAEFDRLGFGRIEILTKPGSDKFRGQAFFNFNDESLNSRNPFAVNRAPSQTRYYGGSVSGPLQKGKSSYFIDISNREVDNGSLLNAQTLDSALNIVSLNQEFTQPTRRFSFSPRIDYQLNDKNTLVARYSFSRNTADNQGIGDTSLPSRAYETSNRNHEVRLTETMIINSKTVNETRFEFENSDREVTGDNTIPTISVPSAFTGGGAQIGLNFTREKSIELQNYTTTSLGKNNRHAVKFGFRLRSNWLEDRSESNYGGTFVFSGFFAPNDPFDLNGDGLVSPIEQYRAKISGATDDRYNPSQFSITSGNPLASVSQTDIGLFVTDDWRVNPGLTLSFGLRYENQTNISDNLNFAPRFSFAWSPGAGGARPPKTVFRGGIGIFYDRFSDNYTLNADRFDGVQQFSYIVRPEDTESIALLSQPVFTLDGVTNVPTATQLGNILPLANTIRRVSPDLQSPYTIQTVFSVERQLPGRITVSASYIGARTLHQLRARNINAPICPTFIDCQTAPVPDPTLGDVYQYESSGYSNQQQLVVGIRSFLNRNFSLFGNYRLGSAKSDSDGGGSFPAYSYDLNGEYGRSSFDIRHFFIVGGSFGMPWGVRLSPFIIANSGRPFNIITGIDTNNDSLYTERPTYAQLSSRCNELGLTNSFCDVSGVSDLNQTIPRNYGRGPSSVTVNLRVNKTFGFGKSADSGASAGNQQGGQGGGGGRGGRRGGGFGGGRGGGGFGGGDSRSPYNLTVGINFNNLFNTVNFANPVSNLSSSRFGQYVATQGGFGGFRGGGGGGNDSGNRRIELQLRFSF